MEATWMSIDRWMDRELVVHTYNAVFLSHKKECIWVSSNEVDEPRTYYTEWTKSEREKQILFINVYIWNLERWYWWTYLQGSIGDVVREQTCRQELGKEKEGWIERVTLRHIHSVQSLSRVRLFATLWTAARQASLSTTNSRSPPKPMSIQSVMPSNLSRPLLLLPPVPPSIRVFSNESTLHMKWPKYWSFSFSISPSNEHPGLISFRMDWLDLLAVQGTLKSLLQHHTSKASILRCSAFLIVQLSHPYMTTGKTIALTRRTLVDKVMSLLFNIYLGW